jgi:hypothetical protein
MYAHVCSCMLMYAHVCSCMLMYAHVCSCMLMYAHVCSCIFVDNHIISPSFLASPARPRPTHSITSGQQDSAEMGCDGGSIPGRRDLVKTKKTDASIASTKDVETQWKTCALSAEALQTPIVICPLGRLMNKTAVINHLLRPNAVDRSFDYISSLKVRRLLSHPLMCIRPSMYSMLMLCMVVLH